MRIWPGASWMQRHQIVLYLIAIVFGAVLGLQVSSVRPSLEASINPFLGLLLYATFLSLPLTKLLVSFRDLRFMAVLGLVNFVLVPAIVFILTRFIADDQALLYGVLLVLLAPCIDYVIVFAGIAGGDSTRLLAATPLLLLLQVLLVPAYMFLIAGSDTLALIDPKPFLRALLGLIVVPFIAAFLTQLLMKRFAFAVRIGSWADYLMVPLMMGTLLSVVGSQINAVASQFQNLATAIALFVVFVAVMAAISTAVGKLFHLETAPLRAVTFSGVTRNSLVVLPLALALPPELSLASAVVVSQTLVELVGMLVLIQLVPRFVTAKSGINDHKGLI
ncbi:arsenic resistance protein [Glutamicibacter ardleyensis]|uniref:arsenic resistance protein n=1 Tax=Glutamicibacter ardleyensis TaxID=225894 RepID=UPI000BB7D101|nr:bile acid:sodium symporter [Glutamicibacter sp. BW77]PCC37201.1 arsenic resistance protein [Glutamicibacter sp. BW77]HBV10749.1 arsenic resistance protein [Micrococcaceae bacterium]